MFLAIDETDALPKKILGGLLLPRATLPELEKKFIQLRLKHKLFGELKWTRIDQYYKRYLEFVDLVFDDKDITFHSTCYRRAKYKAAYVFVRGITWKLQNAGLSRALFIVFDNDGPFGDRETREIQHIAQGDRKFKQRLDFCRQGASHVIGALQLADLLSGAVCAVANNTRLSAEKKAFVNHIVKRNGGVRLDWTCDRFPGLTEFKMHYFDPDSISSIRP